MAATSYSQFTLIEAVERFGLTFDSHHRIFGGVARREPSEFLSRQIEYGLPVVQASQSEKVRSEMLIAPILLEVTRTSEKPTAFYSGIDFNVSQQDGLSGYCDYLLARTKEPLLFKSPILAVIEAKKENLNGGLGQCIAEMVAAQRYNQSEGNGLETVYGSVTSGEAWNFMKLQHTTVNLDSAIYYLVDLPQILGILLQIVQG